jgi:hypothetical protein
VRCSSSSSSCFFTWLSCWVERAARSTVKALNKGETRVEGRVTYCFGLLGTTSSLFYLRCFRMWWWDGELEIETDPEAQYAYLIICP